MLQTKNGKIYRFSAEGWARRESFGILFYNRKDANLTFVRSADLLEVGEDKDGGFLRPNGRPECVDERLGSLINALAIKGLLSQPENTETASARGGTSLCSKKPYGEHDATRNEALSAPVNVTWEITARCNLHCRHCLSADVMARSATELSFDQCREFIDTLRRLQVFQINLGGGEPFLRPDFVDILEYAHSKGITTCVSTNGTTLNETLVRRLKRMSLLFIQVSIDGASAATNDLLRGPDTFDRILSGIRLLAENRIPGVSTNTVVTAVNFKEVPRIWELGRKLGVKTRLSRFRPSGGAKREWSELHLKREQLAELSAFLSAHKDILTGDSFFSITGRDRRQLGLNMCGAAKMTCGVSPDGTVYPCAFLQDPAFVAGNVTQTNLGAIWREAPIFAAFRNARIKSCESCSRFSLCHGGCPAVAFFLTHSLDQPDPECIEHFPKSLHAEQTFGTPTANA